MKAMREEGVYVLAIETSCDETAVAIVRNGREVISNVISSQIDLHTLYGGVVPEIASRKHVEVIDTVLQKALDDANMTLDEVDVIGATYGPGLVGALLVGLAEAKAIAFAKAKPFVGVHHIEGHICANYIQNQEFEPPYVCLVVSGGHTHLICVEDYGKYEIIGKTRDDAVGEAYDKVARAIGMGYPGGPKIDKAAKKGAETIPFPRVYLEADSYDFSFSGVKSSVLNYLNKQNMMKEEIIEEDVACSFQEAVVEVLVSKTIRATKEKGMKKVALAGGVASNTALRRAMKEACEKEGFYLSVPDPILCTDNGAMIASAAFYEYQKKKVHDMSLNAVPSMELGKRAR